MKKKLFLLVAYDSQSLQKKNCTLFIKKRKYFSIVLEKKNCISLHFYGIYNKFVKFLNDLVNILTTLSFLLFFFEN